MPEDMKVNIYYAASMFTVADRTWNKQFTELLSNKLLKDYGLFSDVYLPQDAHAPNDLKGEKWWEWMYDTNMSKLKTADIVVAVMEGADVDAGLAYELGYAAGLKIPRIAVRTDIREGQVNGVNLMLAYPEILLKYGWDIKIETIVDDVAKLVINSGVSHNYYDK